MPVLMANWKLTEALSWSEISTSAPTGSRIFLGILGGVLLLFGSRSRALVNAAPGVLLGSILASVVLQTQSTQTQMYGAIGAGVIGGLIALAMQAVALRVAGALIGAISSVLIYEMIASSTIPPWWLPLGGAVVGALILPRVFNSAMGLMSPLIGAFCLSFACALNSEHQLYGVVGFTIAGYLIRSKLKTS